MAWPGTGAQYGMARNRDSRISSRGRAWRCIENLKNLFKDRSMARYTGSRISSKGIGEAQRLKGTVSRDFRLLVFFHESVSPKPLSILLGSNRIFSKIRGDIPSSRFATGVNDTGGKCKKSSIIKVLII